MLAIVLTFGVFLVAGLVVVPAMTDEAEAGCKSKKSKKQDFLIAEDYSYQMISYQMIKCSSGNPEH
jgi:uncharacterized membrane protein YjgN (DUF898 family)